MFVYAEGLRESAFGGYAMYFARGIFSGYSGSSEVSS